MRDTDWFLHKNTGLRYSWQLPNYSKSNENLHFDGENCSKTNTWNPEIWNDATCLFELRSNSLSFMTVPGCLGMIVRNDDLLKCCFTAVSCPRHWHGLTYITLTPVWPVLALLPYAEGKEKERLVLTEFTVLWPSWALDSQPPDQKEDFFTFESCLKRP